MNIPKKLWNWCRRPIKPASTNFTRLTAPLHVSILISGLLLTLLVALVLLPQIAFPSGFRLFSDVDESGRATEVVERVLFPGGAIMVYKVPVYDPRPTWHINIIIHNYVACGEDLSAYVNSRTNAINELLNSLNANEKVQVTVTFKEPLEPDDFKNLYENYSMECDGLNSAIIVENVTSGKLETIRLNAPGPEYLEQFITYPKEGLKTVSVISIEALIRVDTARTLAQDSRVLLVDPQKCLTVRALMNKYSPSGFKVSVDPPPLLIKNFTHELTYDLVAIDELLNNPSKYNRWSLYFVGKVSDLSLIENTFKLDAKLLVCYKYYEVDLSEQINAEDIKNGEYVTVIGTFFQERSTLYAEKIEKKKQEPPSTLTVDELLSNATEYDGQMVQVFGRVSDLESLDGPFFKLDGKILVCYAYDNIDLSSQISGVENGDPMIVTGMFSHDNMTLYARHIRPSR